jgi:ABC-type polysaccharide/polyol phosphate transport system ATPase subunit
LGRRRGADQPIGFLGTCLFEVNVLDWKIKAVVEEFRYGHPCTQLDDRIYDPAYDFVLEHNMYAVQTLCDEIYVMADGRVLTHGEHGAVFQEPRVLEAYLGKDYAAPS